MTTTISIAYRTAANCLNYKVMATSDIKTILDGFAALCNNAPIRNEFGIKIEQLAARLDRPCTLAIAGRVKAGKSSFLNALLGMDLAKVGDTETTATINIFKYGKPENPEKPIKVVWDSGNETFADKGFMDSLQGHDEETLRKAQGIKYLEYYVENDILKNITLVDTPGTDAIVGQDDNEHEKRTRSFFRLLRDKHCQQTENYTHSADAVIYLVGPVPTMAGQTFLNEFKGTVGSSSAINSIGVLAKIDINEELTAKRKEQAQYVAKGLKEQLATVIPVSAGLWMTLQKIERNLPEMFMAVKSIPSDVYDYFMQSEECYYEEDIEVLSALYDGTEILPPSLSSRQSIRNGIPWSIFRTICNSLYRCQTWEESRDELYDISGIERVKDILDRTFFKRTKIIREYNLLLNLRPILYGIRNRIIPKLIEYTKIKEDIIEYINQAPDKRIRNALLSSVETSFLTEKEYNELIDTADALNVQIENMILELEASDRDFSMLQLLEKGKGNLAKSQYDELCVLFGLYEGNLPENHALQAQQWNLVANCAANNNIRQIAEYAVIKYSHLIINRDQSCQK